MTDPTPTTPALTITQPWADAITHGPKRVENRSWPAPARHHGTRILIHAGLTADRQAQHFDPGGPYGQMYLRLRSKAGQRGAILATALLTGCHLDAGCCRPWGMPELYHWQLADVQALAVPVPAKGRLGLWTPPADVLAAVHAQDTRPAA